MPAFSTERSARNDVNIGETTAHTISSRLISTDLPATVEIGSHMRLTVSFIAIVLCAGSLASAQSLAELARKTEERRESTGPMAKSYSNKDLVFDPASASAARLESAPPQDRPKIAAAQFLGYFLKHTRGYSEYCRQNWGIDLATFVTSFSDAHKTEYARAQKTITDAGLSEESVWASNETLLRQSVVQDMTEIPGVRGSMAGCNGLNAGAATLARDFHFSKVFPDAHRALMAAQPSR